MRRLVPILALTLAAASAAAQTPPRLQTRWAAQVNPDRVLPEYPRPQMVSPTWQSLNGPWDYAITDRDAAPPSVNYGRILVSPSPSSRR